MDFKTVLEAFTETSIPVPGHHKWAKSGMVRSRICTVIWRTLDAQYWGVPQRRRRIFLVADYTGGEGTEEILFKPESLSRNTATSKETQQDVAADTGNGIETAKCYDMSHACDAIRVSDKSPTLQARMGTGGNQIPLTYSRLRYEEITADDKATCLRASGGTNGGGSENLVMIDELAIRKLTPLECERLQGLPDNWTLIEDKTCSDSARYKAIGNGMAQPCADFVMSRITEHEMSKRA